MREGEAYFNLFKGGQHHQTELGTMMVAVKCLPTAVIQNKLPLDGVTDAVVFLFDKIHLKEEKAAYEAAKDIYLRNRAT